MTSGDIVGRVSKGVGLPGALPDIAGLAWRMPPTSQGAPPWDGLSLDTVRDRIATTGVEFDIEQAAGTGRFRPLARLTLHTVATDVGDLAFDPTVHSHPDVALSPGWLTGFRQAAYRRSREGREAE